VAEITKTMHIGIGGFMRCGGGVSPIGLNVVKEVFRLIGRIMVKLIRFMVR
jgi:hypothetical protein